MVVAMTELLEEAPKKRPKISSDDEEIIELDVSDEGNLEEDVELENKLRHAQADLDEIHDEMLQRLKEVEREYECKKTPLYKARAEVIKCIPGFWLHCFLQHQEIKTIIGDVDNEILTFLTEVSLELSQTSKDGYTLRFRFQENDWFEDEVLTKSIVFIVDTQTENQSSPEICHTKGSKPKWKKEDPTSPDFLVTQDWRGKQTEGATFISWLTAEQSLEPGLVDPVADIIKDQLYVNPLEYLDAEVASEVQGAEELLEEDFGSGEEPLSDEYPDLDQASDPEAEEEFNTGQEQEPAYPQDVTEPDQDEEVEVVEEGDEVSGSGEERQDEDKGFGKE